MQKCSPHPGGARHPSSHTGHLTRRQGHALGVEITLKVPVAFSAHPPAGLGTEPASFTRAPSERISPVVDVAELLRHCFQSGPDIQIADQVADVGLHVSVLM